LLFVERGGRREELVLAAGGQDWIATAPAVVCIASVFDRTTEKYGNRGRGYVYMEAGHAAQSLMLEAVALGLATTMVGAFDDGEVARILHLDEDETPLCLIPVGMA
jgi:SagB-type dehydrogenase family enzyme